MNRKVLKKALPFLMVLTLAGTTVFAEGDVSEASVQPLATEEPAEGGSKEASEESLEEDEIGGSEERPEESEAEASEESIEGDETDDSEEGIEKDETDDSVENVDGDETGTSEELPEIGEGNELEKGLGADGASGDEIVPDMGDELVGANVVYTSEEGFQFYFTWSGGVVISGYKQNVATLVIPAKLTYGNATYNVEGIGNGAFEDNTTITSVQIAEGLTYIGESAFYGCHNIQSVSFPQTLREIRSNAFSSSYGSLKRLVLPEGLIKIEELAFADQPLREGITFPSTLKQIGSSAFWQSEFPAAFLPSGLESIGEAAFGFNPELQTVIVPGSVKTIVDSAFKGCDRLSNVTLENGIQKIEGYAFAYDSNLKAIYIPESVTYIDYRSFWNSGLTTVYCERGSIADNTDYYGSNIEIVYGNLKVEAPTFREVDYIGGKDIAFTSATRDAVIYYSTNSSNITTNDECVANGGRAVLDGFNGTIYAKAYYSGQWSDVVSYVLKTDKVATPTISVSGNKVTINAPTSESTIYYTIDGSIPTVNNGIKGEGGSLSLDCFDGTVKAVAVKSGYTNSDVASYDVKAPQVETPTITVSGDKVTINAPTDGSTIYYTTDGSTPTVEKGIKGNGATVTLDSFAGTLKAIAVKNGCSNSAMARKVLVNSAKRRNVSFGVKGVFGGRNVTFSSELKGAKIYYSSKTSKLTTKDKCVNAGATQLFEDFYGTIYARTYYNGEWGNVCRLILKIPVVNAPTISVDRNGYATIRTTTPNCRIYYTTNGTTPSMSNGKLVASSYVRVYVGKGKTIKAMAVRSCFTNSKVTTYR